MDNVFILMPAYNETDNIENIVEEWHPIVRKIGAESRLVIVDDGSKDNTFEKLQVLSKRFRQLLPLSKPNSGHGATCLFAYDYAMKNAADFVFQTDSDGQTSAAEFELFWKQRDQYDLIVGIRKNREDGFNRIVVSTVLKWLLFLIFGVFIKDPNTPFRLMRASSLKQFYRICPHDFFLANTLMSVFFVKQTFRTKWIPISFKTRQGGENTINLRKIFIIGFKSFFDFVAFRKILRGSPKDKSG